MTIHFELPAALITTSSESLFMTLNVWATASASANGTTIGIIDGRISVAISKKVKADWPLSVTKVDACQNLCRPDYAQRPDERCHQHLDRPSQDIEFNDFHRSDAVLVPTGWRRLPRETGIPEDTHPAYARQSSLNRGAPNEQPYSLKLLAMWDKRSTTKMVNGEKHPLSHHLQQRFRDDFASVLRIDRGSSLPTAGKTTKGRRAQLPAARPDR